MKKINTVAIIGLGALGSAYAAKLHEMSPAGVKIIAGGERAGRYKAEGFMINGKRYDFNYVSPEGRPDPVDFIIVAVKTYQLQQAIIDMKNYVGEDTIILSLMNGITSEELIGAEYGMEKMLYAVSFGLTTNREGNRVNFPDYGNLAFGERINNSYSDKVKAVKDLFDRAGIPCSIPENMIKTLWWKFMVNVGVNQCSAVTRGRYGLFQTVAGARELADATMHEVIALSEKEGVNLNEADLEKWYSILAKLDPGSRTSMLEDIESRRRTEVDAFAGTVCALGEKHGLKTPVNKMLLTIIKLLEQSY